MLPLTPCVSRAPAAALRAVSGLILLGVTGCGKPLDRAECEALLDRYTELLVRSDRGPTTAAEVVKLKAAARARAERDPSFNECPSRVSRRAFECAMAAENVDRLEQCLL
jgi:hypothetical protein